MRQAAEGAGFGLSGAVLVDDGSEVRVAVEGCSGDTCMVGDGDEGDLLPSLEELGAGAFDADEGGFGHVPVGSGVNESRGSPERPLTRMIVLGTVPALLRNLRIPAEGVPLMPSRILRPATVMAAAVPMLLLGGGAADASEVVTLTRCQVYLVNAGPGTIKTCNFTASSINGLAAYSVVTGHVHLDISCTYGGDQKQCYGGDAGTYSYVQIGTCTAALYVDNDPEGGLATAVADVGSTGL